MNQNKDIDIRIRKAQAELRCLEKQQREILEKIRLLRLQKSQSAENLNFLESAKPKVTNLSSQKEKISLFRSLFKGREDVFPIRWENLKKEINGYQPGCKNEWVTGICEKPKIGPHRETMRARISEILGVSLERIGVKGTTTERLGFTGRGEGVAAQAIATVKLPTNE